MKIRALLYIHNRVQKLRKTTTKTSHFNIKSVHFSLDSEPKTNNNNFNNHHNYKNNNNVATTFQQLWISNDEQQSDGQREMLQYNVECCACVCHQPNDDGGDELLTSTIPSQAFLRLTSPIKPNERLRRLPLRAEKPQSGPTTECASPECSFYKLCKQYTANMSIHVRGIVFVTTLATVAAVPILIVVYRGRVIGWLMSAVFHEDVGKTISAQAVDSASEKDDHRHHSFFLINYTNSGKLSNWRTVIAAACATFVQLTAIVAVHNGYSAIAEWLTKYSYRSIYDPRFQSRYITYMSCFDFANYYSSLIYIAFFKVHIIYMITSKKSTHILAKNFSRSHFWRCHSIMEKAKVI